MRIGTSQRLVWYCTHDLTMWTGLVWKSGLPRPLLVGSLLFSCILKSDSPHDSEMAAWPNGGFLYFHQLRPTNWVVALSLGVLIQNKRPLNAAYIYIYILMNLFMKLIDDLIESILKLPKYLFNSILGGRLQKMWQDGAPQRLRRSNYMTFPVAHECHSAPSLFVASCLQPGLIDACQRQELCDLLIECSVTLGAFNLFRLHAWLAGPQ